MRYNRVSSSLRVSGVSDVSDPDKAERKAPAVTMATENFERRLSGLFEIGVYGLTIWYSE